jgi:hypothetical protein
MYICRFRRKQTSTTSVSYFIRRCFTKQIPPTFCLEILSTNFRFGAILACLHDSSMSTDKTDSSRQIFRRKQKIKLSHERKSSWVITVDYLLFVLNVRFIRVVSCSNATWVKTIRQHKRVNRNQIQLTQRRIKHNNGLHLNRVLDHTNT